MSLSLHDPETQDKIIHGMMRFVPSHGWSREALRRGALQAGFSEPEALLAFQGDLDKALMHFIHQIDAQMKERLASCDLLSLRIRDRIAASVLIRLEILEPFREALPRILLYQMNPFKMPDALSSLWGTASEIWYEAGDTATDFNYYSKRALLTGVYASTFLFWLRDASPRFGKTKDFLNQSLETVMKIPSLKQKIKKTLGI